MAEPRQSRELQSRATQTRVVYTPPSTLPSPNERPGIVHRWVATHLLGAPEPTNVSQKLREGWVPVKAEDYPELMLAGHAKTGNVEIGGLMLCAMPAELAQARSDYYSEQARRQMESVDNNLMKENDPRMPLFAERKTTTSRGGFGNGTA